MKVTYDRETDSLTITLRKASIEESDEIAQDVIADFDQNGEVVGFEILRASRLVDNAEVVEFEKSA